MSAQTPEAKPTNPFPFPLVLVEREADGSLYFLCTESGKLEGTHKYFWAFDIACDKREAAFIVEAVNQHAPLASRAALAADLAAALEDAKRWITEHTEFKMSVELQAEMALARFAASAHEAKGRAS